MKIEPRPTRVRVHAVVAPETLRWLTDQKTKYQISFGTLIDNLVGNQRRLDHDARQ